MPTQFSDLGKRARKLLNDDYIFNTKLKIASSTADGRTYTVNGATNGEGKGLSSDLSVKQKLGSRTVTTKFLTNGAATTEVKLENLGVKGLQGTISGGVGKEAAKVKLEYTNNILATTTLADYYKKMVESAATCTLSSAKMRGYAVCGVETTYNTDKSEMKDFTWGLSYFDGGDSEMSLFLRDKGAKAQLAYSHLVRKDLAFAFVAEYPSAEDSVELTMGVAKKLDNTTTLKGKLCSNGQMALTYLQPIRPDTTLTISSTFDVRKMEPPKFGLGLAIE